MRNRHDAGETLVEVVLTIFIVSIAVTALIASLSTAASSAISFRDEVNTDTVMRNYAEAVKLASKSCQAGVAFPTGLIVYPALPKDFKVRMAPASPTCPAVNQTLTITLYISWPGAVDKQMVIKVRTP